MSNAARDSIFLALSEHAASNEVDAKAIEAQANALLNSLNDVRPAHLRGNIVDSFIERINGPKVAASVERIGAITDLPACIDSFLQARELSSKICLQPTAALTELDWSSAGLSTEGELDDGVAIALARWGIAETGTLVMHSGPDTPILLNMLPAVHIMAVHASDMLWYLEDYTAAARATGEPTPRNACLITGASGTTDIEGSLVTGAHGPGVLHVVVIDDAR